MHDKYLSKRSLCRLCDSPKLILVVPLEPTPVAEKYLTSKDLNKQEEIICPLDLYMCKNCGHVQLIDIVDPNYLYSDYTYSSGNSPELVNHFKEYANEIIKKFMPKKDSLIVDLGSNDGTFLGFFKNYNYRVVGVDPADKIALEASKKGVYTIPKFFNDEVSENILKEFGKAKIVFANNAFAHMDDLQSFLMSIKKLMSNESIFVFEVSYLLDVIEKNLLGTIFHEHHSYHSLLSLNNFFDKFDMEIVDVSRNNIQGGSLIGVVQFKNGSYKKNKSVRELLNLEKEKKINNIDTLLKFSLNLNNHIIKIKEILINLKRKKSRIVGFGAARSGTTLISQMKIGSFLDYIVDDSEAKQGKFSPGEHLLVRPTSTIYDEKPDYIFILAWVHSSRIIKEHQKYLNNGGRFINCFPEVEIIKNNQF